MTICLLDSIEIENRRRSELTNNKSKKGKYHLRTYLKDIFGFAKHQEKATCGLCYKLILSWNKDNAVLNKHNDINKAKIIINSIEWQLPHYTPSIQQQAILSKQVFSKTPTELQYIKRSVFMQKVNRQKHGIFILGLKKAWTFLYL